MPPISLRPTPERIAARSRRLSGGTNSSAPRNPHCRNTDVQQLSKTVSPNSRLPTVTESLPEPSVKSVLDLEQGRRSKSSNAKEKEQSANTSANSDVDVYATSTQCPEPSRETNEMDALFTFLLKTKTKDQLQKFAGKLGLVKRGTKKELIARMILHFHIKKLNDAVLAECWRDLSIMEEFNYFWNTNQSWDTCPDTRDLFLQLPVREGARWRRDVSMAAKFNDNDVGTPVLIEESENQNLDPLLDSPGRSIPSFSPSEFARLCVILRDDNQARAAMTNAVGLELTRAQLDSGVVRDSFWVTVENRFNNPAVLTREDFRGVLDGVDCSRCPLAHRSAALLKTHYRDSKKDFTVYYQNWSASGKNDPDRFCDFLPRLPNGAFMSSSARCVILFRVCRCGTPDEDTNLLRLVTRVMAKGVGYDTGVNGCENSDNDVEPQRKKRRSADSVSLKNMEGYLAQVSRSSLHLSQALSRSHAVHDEVDEKDSRMHSKLELLRAELRSRQLDEQLVGGEDCHEAQKVLKEASQRHLNSLLETIRNL